MCLWFGVTKVARISEYSKIIHLLLFIHNSLVNTGDQKKQKQKQKKHPLFLPQVYTDIYSVPASLYSDEKMR